SNRHHYSVHGGRRPAARHCTPSPRYPPGPRPRLRLTYPPSLVRGVGGGSAEGIEGGGGRDTHFVELGARDGEVAGGVVAVIAGPAAGAVVPAAVLAQPGQQQAGW